MKQSCRLLNSRLLRLAQVEIAEQPPDRIERSRTSGCSILLNQPISGRQPPRDAVGQQEVEILLLHEPGDQRAHRHAGHTVAVASARSMDSYHDVSPSYGPAPRPGGVAGQAEVAPATVEGEAPVAGRACPHVAADGVAGAVLRVRRAHFFYADDAPDEVAARAAPASRGWPQLYGTRFAETVRLTAETADGVSDLQFTDRLPGAVPVQPLRAREPRAPARSCSRRRRHAHRSRRQQLLRPDGFLRRQRLRLRFLQGVHGARRTAASRDLGPVLGAYHPVVAYNVERLTQISGLDEVSFHMSGTEAVMQAVRLARYHTRRTHLVRFCGAYHGWWGDVQPGVGNPLPARETYTLKEMSDRYAARAAHAARHRLRAGQSAAGAASQRSAPADSALVDSTRSAHFDREAYTAWLQELREVCNARSIVLIFDEVFVGFRLAPGGAQDYFGVARRLVTYGKTLGGGLPIGVVCGRRHLMKRYRDDRPVDVCFARGTFNSHPYVMGAMYEFLHRLETPDIRALYRQSRRGVERAGSAAQPPSAGRRPAGRRSPTCRRSGPSTTRSRRATTGCCNITSAPRAWRSAGSAPAG